jgi:cell division protein FtsZ
VAADTDAKALKGRVCPLKNRVGAKTTNGDGRGDKIEMGRKSAEESMPEILAALAESDLVFLTGGLGGGACGGGLPLVAQSLAKLPNKPPVVVAVVTIPPNSEDFRQPFAKKTLEELYARCNSVIVVDNEKLESLDPEAPYLESIRKANDVLYRAVASIVGIVETAGEINVDFADVAAVLKHKGPAIISYGEAKGEKRASEALLNSLANPLIADATIDGAEAVICDIAADDGILVREVVEVNETIRKTIGPKAKLFFGLVIDEKLKETGTLRVTLLASGLPRRASNQARGQDTGQDAGQAERTANLGKTAPINFEAPPTGASPATSPTAASPQAAPLQAASSQAAPPQATPPQAAPPRLVMEVEPGYRPLTQEAVGDDANYVEMGSEPVRGPYATVRRTLRPVLGSRGGGYRRSGVGGVGAVGENPALFSIPPYRRNPRE